MANHAENPHIPALDPGIALPKIVRVTAITLLAYGLVMFSFGVYLPIWAYKASGGEEVIIAVPFYILVGTAIILISFGLFKGGYAMLHREAYGTWTGSSATMWSFFPSLFLIYIIGPISREGVVENEAIRFLAMFIFFILDVFFLRGLSRADKILKGVG